MCFREAIKQFGLESWPVSSLSDDWTSLLVRFCKLNSPRADVSELRVVKESPYRFYTSSSPLDRALNVLIDVKQLVRADHCVTTAERYR